MKLALGTAQFGLPYGIANLSGQVGRAQASRILALARSNGIDTLDTAIGYGESEACLGALGIDGLRVVTKLPALPEGHDDVRRWVHEQVGASLERLAAPALYGLLLHRSQQLVGPEGAQVARAFEELKAAGTVRKVGVSIYSPLELDSVTRAAAIDLVQAPFNLLDRRLQASGWLSRLHAAGVEVHVRSAFLQGLLLMPRASVPAQFAPWSRIWDAWHEWLAARPELSAAQVALGFVQSFAAIDRVVVGVDDAAQLEQLILASRAQLSAEWPAIGSDDEQLINPFNWNRP